MKKFSSRMHRPLPQSLRLCLAIACLLASPLMVAAQEKVTPPWQKTLSMPLPILDSTATGLWEIDLDFPATKMYTISLKIAPTVGAVSGELIVDGATMEKFKLVSGATTVDFPPVFFDAGPITVGVNVKKGQLQLESMAIRDSLKIHAGPPRAVPVNPQANPATRSLMAWLASEYGKHIISGQQDLTWDDSIDMTARVKAQTGKEPALMGYDFLNYLGASDGGNGLHQVEEAIAWHQRGGLVAFCWHWRMGPSKQFYTAQTDFRIKTDPTSPEWQQMIKDIDTIAIELKRLQAAGVTVLWRPLHEASGGWFWWGASGPTAYKAAWNLMYERLTNVHKLNNLIWVWNGQNQDWYPGDGSVDIVSMDIYGGDKMYNSWKDSWVMAQGMVTGDEGRMVALSENGPFPDPDNLIADQVPWSWFMTWNDGNKGKPEDDYFSGDKYMDAAHKRKVFNHPYVITLDEMPKLKP